MRKKRRDEGDAENRDVAQLFFDSFSKRVGGVEDSLRNVASGFERLKLSVERGQISDLVLLERVQKAEQLIKASLRSEEHTSELQSHSDLVCRLLLEKKKNDLAP